MSRPALVTLAVVLSLALSDAALAEPTRLLRRPAVSRELVAFEYGGDLWTVPRSGGPARRLTSTPNAEIDPWFSPDGSRVAFTATVGGNTDVYVVPVSGGEPTRLTFHPSLDAARGWSPDGGRVLFASTRETVPVPGLPSIFRLWSVAVDARGAVGSVPEVLPMPRAFTGTYSPDGRRIAYEEIGLGFASDWAQNQSSLWRNYRGGRTRPIRLVTLAGHAVEKLPWSNSNDSSPMWVGDTVYFLSDRNGRTNLFSYRPGAKEVTALTRHDTFDIMNASATSDAIVYEQGGDLHLLDLASKQARKLTIEVAGDFPWARQQLKKVASMVRSAVLSPTGVRAAFEARGEIFTVPTEKGQPRNLTQSSGTHDRSPVWSPDGRDIAWLSDAGGEYQLMIAEQTAMTNPRTIALPSKGFFSAPAWSPDGKQLLLEDNHLGLWTIDVASGAAVKLDADTYDDPGRRFDAVWSPDSQWIAYSKSLDSHLRAIFLYSIADKRAHQVTDGLSDATAPAFDASGKYLYFLASTNYALRISWLEMSSVDRPVTPAVYLAVLGAGEPSPLLPETGDEPVKSAGDSGKPAPAPPVKVDIKGIDQRILALGVPAGDYA
jgi:tricorn protease